MKLKISLSHLISLIVLISLLAQFSSCNTYIEKRRYRKGYYVSHMGKPQSNTVQHSSTIETVHSIKNEVVQIPIQSTPIKQHVEAANIQQTSTGHHPQLNKKQRWKNKPSFVVAGNCDILFLKDGTSLEILVTSINDKMVTYKKCNYPDGPSYELSILKVESIEYKNGEIYRPVTTNQEPTVEATPDGRMITSLIFAIISLIAVIASFVLLAAFGGGIPFGLGFFACIPLFIAGPFSLAGLIMSGKYARKGSHLMGKVAFYLNLIAQILAIIALVLCFLPI